MKKNLFIAIILFLGGIAIVQAQPRAIGVRVGYGAELSYQHTLGNNMLSVEAGVPAFAGLNAAVTYDWINPFSTQIPWNEKGEWNWYMGVGGAGAFYLWGGGDDLKGGWFAGVAGRIGIEYDFWFPLQLSLDWRPTLGVGHYGGNWGFSGIGALWHGAICLGVRYKFN